MKYLSAAVLSPMVGLFIYVQYDPLTYLVLGSFTMGLILVTVSFLKTPPAAILEYAKIVGMVSGICLIFSTLVFFGMLLVETIKEYK